MSSAGGHWLITETVCRYAGQQELWINELDATEPKVRGSILSGSIRLLLNHDVRKFVTAEMEMAKWQNLLVFTVYVHSGIPD